MNPLDADEHAAASERGLEAARRGHERRLAREQAAAATYRPPHGGYPGHPAGGGMDRLMGYALAAELVTRRP